MNLLGLLENGLFALGQVLRFPVMSLLWVCVATVCFMAGACFIDLLKRRSERENFNIKKWLGEGGVINATGERLEALPLHLHSFLEKIQKGKAEDELKDGGIEHLVMETEEDLKQTLNISRMLIKVAPSIGLLGTLIPMGVSLASMAAGNLDAMAGQMVVAFTTTIIGLACGTASYVINMVRQNWVNELIREQRFMAERIVVELNPEEQLDD